MMTFVGDARRFWTLLEPVHAITYFAPESRAAYEAAGLRGFWRGYFAGRLAPLGRVDQPVATAVLYGFAPAMVARGVPSIWDLASPERALEARLAGADAVLRRLWDPDDPALGRTAELLARVACTGVSGRPLFAGNAGLPVPGAPHLAVWHFATLLREHRGDGHVAALVAADLDGLESLVTHVAAGGAPRDALQAARGWSDEEWAAAERRLAERGWLEDGHLTVAGERQRAAIEDATDRAAERAFAALPDAERDELESLLAPLAAAVVASGVLPYPNPIGVPRPAA
jgi:hypothetical protein